MILIDKALEKREAEKNPIRVAMVGAGFMGRGVALQIFQAFSKGMRLVAISNRNLGGALRAYAVAGINNAAPVQDLNALEDNVRKGRFSVTEDAMLLCRAEGVDAIFEVTGSVDFGAQVAMEAIRCGKHLIHMNAEMDATLGPILKKYADRAGVIYSFCDGDQPGVQMNLYRFLKGIGVKPLLCGSIKGLHDPYRNSVTQESFARKWGQKPYRVASFADGSKISFEQAIVANATGMRVMRRGMLGPTVPTPGMPLSEAMRLFPIDELLKNPGAVDYVVGAEPAAGVFIIGTHEHPLQKQYLNCYKLGEGPSYMFYTPYHLCHFEAPNSIARAVLFHDTTLAALDAPQVDVVATAKTNLKKGQIIDAMGCFLTYGQCENSNTVQNERLLPMGVAEGCLLLKDIVKDQVLTYADVRLPKDRFSDKLRSEQDLCFHAEQGKEN
ncbi:MAG: NAD(P)-dependent oxidoreductase [Omnitrophica bacterium GWA2_50_21]|nr:MAG: NAD(P)-dependent oxidoreductase [Omnitrophica bacterium GWA2_50_21]